MKNKEKGKQKPLLDLFIKKVAKKNLPKRRAIFPRDIANYKQIKAEVNKFEIDLEETQAPVYNSMLESIGLNADEMKKIIKKGEVAHKKFRSKLGKKYKEYMYNTVPSQEYWQSRDSLDWIPIFCTEINVRVCKQKVCVDQPVPLPVDDIWVDPNSDGTLTSSSNQFNYEDEVCGYSDWNFSYHRYSRDHEGAINIRSSAELVEPATVRQIGVIFEPLLDYRGWPMTNGVFARGGYRPNPFTPRSRGRGYMWVTFRVDTKLPGGSWVNRSNYTEQYKSTGWINSNITQSHTYPPPRSLDLNEAYPAGTQLLLEVSLSYEIEGNGEAGCAWADYNLEVRPYMNLESCTWEFPDWVCVPTGL